MRTLFPGHRLAATWSRYFLFLLALAVPGQAQSEFIRPQPVEAFVLLNKSRSSGDTGSFTAAPGVVNFQVGGTSVSISLTSSVTEVTGRDNGGFFVPDSPVVFYLGFNSTAIEGIRLVRAQLGETYGAWLCQVGRGSTTIPSADCSIGKLQRADLFVGERNLGPGLRLDAEVELNVGNAIAVYTVYFQFRTAQSGPAIQTLDLVQETTYNSVRNSADVLRGLSPIPLIADKPTMVRVYVLSEVRVVGAKAILRGFRGSPPVELKDPPGPQDAGGIPSYMPLPPRLDRSELDNSFNFALPPEWIRAGELTLTAEVQLPSSIPSAGSLTLTETVTFQEGGSLSIAYMKFCYQTANNCPSDVSQYASFIRMLFPVNPDKVSYVEVRTTRNVWRESVSYEGLDQFGRVFDGGFQYHLQKIYNLLISYGQKFDQLAGWLPSIPEMRSVIGYSDPEFFPHFGFGRVFVGFQTFPEVENARTLAHETAHNLGLRHTNFPVMCKDIDLYTDWPYGTCHAQEVGYDFDSLQNSQHLLPDYGDLMSYLRPYGLSPFHVRKLLQTPPLRLPSATPKTGSLPRRDATQTDDHILISGWAQRDGSAGSLDPAYRIPGNETASPSREGGSHCLRFSGSGGDLGDYCFALSFQNVASKGLSDRQYFTLLAPIPAGATRVALRTKEKELASLTAGSAAPSLAITSPKTGEVWNGGERTITWSASDPDNRSMVFTVLYSSDGGQSWLPMAIDSRQAQLTFDPKEIIGGDKVLFRVLATSGMNSTSADVGPIRVNQSPALEAAPSLEFAATAPGEARVQALKISNPGTGPLMIDSYSIDHPTFAMISGPAPLSLGAGETRDLRIRWTPTTAGEQTATLTLKSNDVTKPTGTIRLFGSAVAPTGCTFRLGAGESAAGATDVKGAVTVTASEETCTWTATANVPWITVTAGAHGNGAGKVEFAVAANPTSVRREGAITIAGLTHTVFQVAGEATPQPGCTFTLNTYYYDHAGSGAATIELRASASDCTFTAVSTVPWARVTSTSSGPPVNGVGVLVGSGDIYYQVDPNPGPPRAGSINISGFQFLVNQGLSQTGTPVITISPSVLDFGAVAVGSSATLTLSVSNKGNGNLTISSTTSSNPMVTVNPISLSLAPFVAAPVTAPIAVRFAPTAAGPQSGILTVTSNDPAQPRVVIAFSGSGTSAAGPNLSTAPASIDFGTVAQGSFATFPLTLFNNGNAPLNITSITASNPMFAVTPSGPLTIPALSRIQVTVRFTPTAAGPQSGDLTIASTDPVRPSLTVPVAANRGSIGGGVAAYWKFDEGSGTIANDSSGNGITGTLANGAGWAAGLSGTAVSLDGTNGHVDAGTKLQAGATFTLEAWIKGDPAGMEQWARILDTGFSTGFALGRYGTTRQVSFEFRGSPYLATIGDVIDNAWHHIVAVKSADKATLYADGVVQGSVTANAGASVSTLPLFIGFNSGDGIPGHWKGLLDEVRIYNRALTDAEILSNYNALKPVASAPKIVVSPASLSFASVNTGSSATLPLTVSNTGNAPLQITALTLSNPFFTVTPSAPITVAAGASTQLTVRFSPTSTGTQAGTLTIASDDAAQPSIQVSLSGSGGAPTTGGVAAYWKFDEGSGTIANDSSGNGITGTLTNGAGWAPGVSGAAVSLDGTNGYVNAGTKLQAGATFTLEAWIKGDPSGMEQWARILDTGFSTGFALGRYGTSRQVSFEFRGSPYLATTADVIDNAWHHIVAVKSADKATLYADGVVQGSVTANAGASVSTLPLFIGFNSGDGIPGHWKGQIDEVRIYNRALTDAEILSNYNALKPPPPARIGVSLTSLSFGSVTVGSSATLALTISNTGGSPLNVTALTSSNALFTVTPAAPVNVAPGASAQLSVRFSPTSLGPQSGTLTIASNDATQASITVSMSGTGTAPPAPVIGVSPTSLNFGSVTAGSSAALAVTISNTGNAALNVTSLSISNGVFTVTPAAPLVTPATPISVAAGASAQLTVRFNPTSAAAQAGTLTIASNDATQSSVQVSLSGTGTAAPAPRISVSPASLNFGSVTAGSSATLVLTISNTGDAALNVTSLLSSNGVFTALLPPSLTVAPGASMQVTVRFTPTSAGAQSGTLTIASASNDATQPSVQVSLSGTGVPQPDPKISVSTPLLDFGTVPPGSSAVLPLTISNTGIGTLNVTGLSSSNGVFTITPAAPLSVPEGSSTQISVRFSPTSPGALNGILTITSNDLLHPSTLVGLSGAGTPPPAPVIAVSPAPLSFGSVTAGSSATLTTRVINAGNASLSVTAITSSNAVFTVTPPAPFSVAAGSSTQLTVRFSPTSPGAHSGTLTVSSNDPAQPVIQVSLSGAGTAPTGADAYWKFDEGSGTVANDASGNGMTGTLLNGASWTSGIRGTALNLDGVDDYMNAGTALQVGATFTIEAWIKGDPTMQDWGRIVDHGYTSSFALGRYGGTKYVALEYRGSPPLVTTKVTIDNNWHHIVVVKAGGAATMYTDGLFQSSVNVDPGGPVSSLPVFVGYNPGEGSRAYWKGQLDEVHIYSRALTATEILANYNALGPTATSTPNPMAYWKFDEAAGAIANDSSGHGYTAALLNGATRAAGIRGNAVSLDGVDDQVDITTSFAVTTANFSLEAWVKGDPTMEAYGRIIDSGFSTGFALGRVGGGSQILFEFRGVGVVSVADAIDNTWHHLAVVKSGTTATIYVDGSADATVSSLNPGPPTNALLTKIGYNPGEGIRGHWKGQLDEVRVYDRALTAAEVQNNYNARGQ